MVSYILTDREHEYVKSGRPLGPFVMVTIPLSSGEVTEERKQTYLGALLVKYEA